MVTDFTYNAITTDFWANLACSGRAARKAWEHHGMDGDAKGQPRAVQLAFARVVTLPDPQGDGRRRILLDF